MRECMYCNTTTETHDSDCPFAESFAGFHREKAGADLKKLKQYLLSFFPNEFKDGDDVVQATISLLDRAQFINSLPRKRVI